VRPNLHQAEDSGVQPDPERQRDQREQSEPRRLEQLPKSKTKISHHMNNRIETRQRARMDSK
jgi:hypothetical protein